MTVIGVPGLKSTEFRRNMHRTERNGSCQNEMQRRFERMRQGFGQNDHLVITVNVYVAIHCIEMCVTRVNLASCYERIV